MISGIVVALINTYSMIIFVYVLMSWFPFGEGVLRDIYRALGTICDPYLDLFRRFIPPIGGMVDHISNHSAACATVWGKTYSSNTLTTLRGDHGYYF